MANKDKINNIPEYKKDINLLEDILKDTAENTLKEQLKAELKIENEEEGIIHLETLATKFIEDLTNTTEENKISSKIIERFHDLHKIKNDPIYFCEKHLKTASPLKGIIDVELHPNQKKFLEEFVKNDKLISCNSRQIGSTTVLCMVAFWYAIVNSNKNIVFISSTMQQSKQNIQKMSLFLNYFKYKRNFAEEDNFYNSPILLRNNSKIFCISENMLEKVRGIQIDLLIIDNADYIQRLENIIKSFAYVKKIVLFSTPAIRKENNKSYFREIYENDESFYKLKFSWDCILSRSVKWFEETTKNLGKNETETELLANFVDSTDIQEPKISFSNQDIISFLDKLECIIKYAKEQFKK